MASQEGLKSKKLLPHAASLFAAGGRIARFLALTCYERVSDHEYTAVLSKLPDHGWHEDIQKGPTIQILPTVSTSKHSERFPLNSQNYYHASKCHEPKPRTRAEETKITAFISCRPKIYCLPRFASFANFSPMLAKGPFFVSLKSGLP